MQLISRLKLFKYLFFSSPFSVNMMFWGVGLPKINRLKAVIQISRRNVMAMGIKKDARK
jgi:hypothetical protein